MAIGVKAKKMMPESQLQINLLDLERHMNDNASRVEVVSSVQKRFSLLQKILLKAQVLSDQDFETAFNSFDAMVDNLKQKTQKKLEQENTSSNKLNQVILNSQNKLLT